MSRIKTFPFLRLNGISIFVVFVFSFVGDFNLNDLVRTIGLIFSFSHSLSAYSINALVGV